MPYEKKPLHEQKWEWAYCIMADEDDDFPTWTAVANPFGTGYNHPALVDAAILGKQDENYQNHGLIAGNNEYPVVRTNQPEAAALIKHAPELLAIAKQITELAEPEGVLDLIAPAKQIVATIEEEARGQV